MRKKLLAFILAFALALPLIANGAAFKTNQILDPVGAGIVVSNGVGTSTLSTIGLNTFVPYTGASSDVDLGSHTLNAQNVKVNGGTGLGVSLEVGGSVDANYYYASSFGQIFDNNANGHLYTLNLSSATADTLAGFDSSKNLVSVSTSTLGIPNYWTLSGANLYNNVGTNVGIGTTTPATQLHLFTSGGASTLRVDTQSSTQPAVISINDVNTSSGTANIYYTPSGASGANVLNIPNSSGFQVGAGASGGFSFNTRSTATTSVIRFATGGNALSNVRMTIGSTGNVGVGTTSPWKLFSVAGDMSLTGAFFDKNNSAGALGSVLQSTITGTQWVATSSLGLSTTNVSEGANLYYTDARVNAYVAASTTIPKTYATNTWTAQQTFNNSPPLFGTMTQGSILFAGASGVLSQDNANFFWDDTANTLSVGSTLGSEKMTNGTFTGNANGWSVGSGWAYSSNTVVHSSNGTAVLSQTSGSMVSTVIIGETYSLSYTISGWSVGTVTPTIGGVTLTARSADGTYNEKFVAVSTTALVFTPSNTARFTIDTVTLKKVTGGVVSGGSFFGASYTATQQGSGATTAAGVTLENTTPATISVLQASPSLLLRGQGYSSSGSVTYPYEVQSYAIGMVNTSPYGKWINQWRGNSGSWAEFLSFDSDPAGKGFLFTPPTSQSNTNPGSTRLFTLNNTGSNTWMDFTFSGTRKATIGATSNGYLTFNSTGANITFSDNSNSILAQIFDGGLYVTQGGFFGGSVTAGFTNTSPPSTFTNYGSTGLKTTKITVSGTLTGTYTQVLVDASGSVCSGSPSNTCASHTDESGCNANDYHGGCSWYGGQSCASFNGTDSSTCTTGHSGCTWDSASCSAFNGTDSTTCNSNSGCSWTGTSDCGAFTGSGEGTCVAYSGCAWSPDSFSDCSAFNGNSGGCNTTSGCSIASSNYCSSYTDTATCNGNGCSASVTNDCSPLSDGGGDGSSCATQPECSYDSGSGSCSGSYFSSCNGDNSTCSGSYLTTPAYCYGSYDPMTCAGSYSPGTCSGTWGSCNGTPTCAGIDDSSSCGSESGCSWTSGIAITLPADSVSFERTYWIKKITSGTMTILPNTDQTIDGASSISTSTTNVAYMLSYYRDLGDCSTVSEGSCSGTTGCSASYPSCSWNGSSCDGGAGCSGYGDEGSCNAATYYSGCSGTYVVSKKWYIMSQYKP